MATIDLGKVKLVWRGTYSGSFNYVPDDVVEYTDGSAVSYTHLRAHETPGI